MHTLTYLALNGSLGTGFKESSLDLALSRPLDFIAADSGSTDGGPYYLGTGEWIWARSSYERDLRLGLLGARRAGVPLIIGSCGGGGGDAAVDGYVELVQEIARAAGIGVRVATVHCEPDREWLAAKYRAGDLRELPGAPSIDESTFAQPGHIVAMAGAEPIQEALDAGADVVLAGRTSDAALFAAIPLARGFEPGPVWNAAKIVECGSAAAENRSGQDCLSCTFDDEGFILEPLDPALRCTPRSVAAHTLYETADPYRLIQPSGTLDARDAKYTALDERRTRVVGGTFTPATEYTAKLEGAAAVGFLSSFWGSTRDPMILRQLDSWIESMTAQIRTPTRRHLRRRLRPAHHGLRRQRHDRRTHAGNPSGSGALLRRARAHPGGRVGDGPGGLPRGPALADQRVDRLHHHLRPQLQPTGRRPRAGLPVLAQPRGGPERGGAPADLPRHPAGRQVTTELTLDDGLDQVQRHFRLIRSKDAGPFMLTLDLFFADPLTHQAFRDSGVFSAETIGELYRVAATDVEIFDLDDISALKISFPRLIPSGDFGDTDITGGQQYAILVEFLAGLIYDENPTLTIRRSS